jgi:hypothetical protein
VSFYVSTATFFLLHCDEWDRVVALPRHKFVTGATLLQLFITGTFSAFEKNSCCVGINSTSSGKSPSKAKFGNSEKASELAILTVFDKLNNCFFIVSLDYELKLTMQIVHPGLLTRSETNTFTVN